jgi:hypothetical protein
MGVSRGGLLEVEAAELKEEYIHRMEAQRKHLFRNIPECR